MVDIPNLPQFIDLPYAYRGSPRKRWNLLVDLLTGVKVFDPETKKISEVQSSSNTGNSEPEVETPSTRNISITVNDGTDPIQGASVVIGETSKTTGSAGGCTFDVADGKVSVEISKEGFVSKTEEITVSEDNTSFTISLTSE